MLIAAVSAVDRGYVLSRTGGNQYAGTRVSLLDPSNAEIASFANGLSIALWVRFNDLSPSRTQLPLSINSHTENNLFQYFGGMAGGWAGGGAAPDTVSTLPGDSAKDWHHYAAVLDGTEERLYVDGALVSQRDLDPGAWYEDEAFIIVGGNAYNNLWLTEESTSVNSDFGLDGEIDDLALYSRALSAAEIDEIMTSSQADGAAADPDLVIFYDFNDGPNGGVVLNKGQAGGDYDLILGVLPKPAGLQQNESWVQDTIYGLTPVQAPYIIPGGPTKNGTRDASAPLVATASAGEAVSITEEGAAFEWTAPTPFNETHVATSNGILVHVVPKMAPEGPARLAGSAGDDAYNVDIGVEDRAVNIQLWGTSSFAPGAALVPRITRLPSGGTLYIVNFSDTSTVEPANAITAEGQMVTSYARYVRYVPDPDGASPSAVEPYDSFAFALVADGVEGPPTNKSIILVAVDDLPVVTGASYTFDEDEHPDGVVVPLLATDAETGSMLDVSIASLPEKGRLYLTTDGTLAGKYAEPISREYSNFDAGGVVYAQVAAEVLAVSSFWGNPPATGYHALNIIGEQSCFDRANECGNQWPWATNPALYPSAGTHVAHKPDGTDITLAARAVSYDEAEATVTVEYLEMYRRPDGSVPDGPGMLVQCAIDPASAMAYPDDCLEANVPASGVVTATLPRTEIEPTKADVWCPLNKGYVGDALMTGGGAFGGQYAYSHNQADYYLTEGYTEFIEVRVPAAVYIVLVEFGMSRGAGAIVGVRAKDPEGSWVKLYKGNALVDESEQVASTGTYWQWAPNTCRTHFTTTDLRIELDTSAETGIEDWNYLDYVKVYGTDSLQPGVLPFGQTSVIYVPDADASGHDAFSFSASDCTGNIFRSGLPATISFEITEVNDAPTTADQDLWADVHVPLSIVLAGSDVDTANLTYTITAAPKIAKLTTFDTGTRIAQGEPWTSAGPPTIVATAGAAGDDAFEYSVSDGTASAAARVSLKLVRVPVDYVPRDASGAYAVYAVIALCVLLKLVLLSYLFLNVAHPVFRGAQPAFCAFTILGGILGDFTPLWLFGAVTTFRCHGFGSCLLLAITALYFPLVLKSYRIWKIFDNPQMKHVKLNLRKLLWLFFAYLLAEIILIVATALTRPIEAVAFDWSPFPQYPTVSRSRCDASGTPFDVIAYILAGLPLAYALYLAAKTRNVKGEYSETKPILAAMYTLILFGGVLLIISYMLSEDNVEMVTYLDAFGILFISTVSVCVFMGPKIAAHLYGVKTAPDTSGTSYLTGAPGRSRTMTQNGTAVEMGQAPDEVAELRAELSEMREKNMELNYNNKELTAKLAAGGGSGAGGSGAGVSSPSKAGRSASPFRGITPFRTGRGSNGSENSDAPREGPPFAPLIEVDNTGPQRGTDWHPPISNSRSRIDPSTM